MSAMSHGKLVQLQQSIKTLMWLVRDTDITIHPSCFEEIIKEEIESCYTYSSLVDLCRCTLNDYLTNLNYPTEIKDYIKTEFRKAFKREFFQQLNTWERKHAPAIYSKDEGWYRLHWDTK